MRVLENLLDKIDSFGVKYLERFLSPYLKDVDKEFIEKNLMYSVCLVEHYPWL